MDMPLTFALALGFGALAAFCGWRGARPPNVIKGPRIIPWRMLMLLSAVGCIMMLVHLVNLAGVPTGNHQGQF
jgi:amino acid transporter